MKFSSLLGRRLFAAVFVLLAPACGGDSPGNVDGGTVGDPPFEGTGSYLPWKEGNTWTYRLTEGADVSVKITTVGPSEMVGGTSPNATKMANKVTTTKGTDKTVSWQTRVGDRIVRYREQAFKETSGILNLEEFWDPAKLHFDDSAERTAAAATWLETYAETKIEMGKTPISATGRDRWTVLGVDEVISVPAGRFRTLHLQKSGGSTAKEYWYARGVGKVKETGGQTEELQSRTLK